MNITQLLQDKREEILQLAEKHGARRVRIFGSVARGEARSDSDVDVLVEFEAGRSLLNRIALMQDLEDLLGRKVHVVTEKALHHMIRDKALAQAVAL